MVLDSKDTAGKADTPSRIRQVQVADGEIDSRELFQTERELRIRHEGMTYRLRLTGFNKLILTK
jgi:hemin uptake protein HemP